MYLIPRSWKNVPNTVSVLGTLYLIPNSGCLINKALLIIHTNWGKPETIHNVDTTRYVATFGCRLSLQLTMANTGGEVDTDPEFVPFRHAGPLRPL